MSKPPAKKRPHTMLRFLAPAQVAGLVGYELLHFVIPLIVYGETHSVLASAGTLAAGWLASALGYVAASPLVGRFGLSRVYRAAAYGRAAACFVAVSALAYAPDHALLVLATLAAVEAFGMSVAHVAIEAFAARGRSGLASLAFLEGLFGIGRIVGPLAAMGLAAFLPPVAILLVAGFGFALDAARWRALAGHVTAVTPVSGRGEGLRASLRAGRQTLREQPLLRTFAVLAVVDAFVWGLAEAVKIPLLVGALGGGEHAVGFIAASAGLAAVVAAVTAPPLARRLGSGRAFAVACAFNAVGFVVVALASDPVTFAAGVVLAELGVGLKLVLVGAERARVVAPKRLKSAVGVFHLLASAPLPLAGLVVGAIGDAAPSGMLLLVAAVVAAAVTAPLVWTIARPGREALPEALPLAG